MNDNPKLTGFENRMHPKPVSWASQRSNKPLQELQDSQAVDSSYPTQCEDESIDENDSEMEDPESDAETLLNPDIQNILNFLDANDLEESFTVSRRSFIDGLQTELQLKEAIVHQNLVH